jgi:SAM-dependent methyltransferase
MHTQVDATAWPRIRAALLDHPTLVRAVGSGRQRGAAVGYRRVELRYVEVKAGLRLQVTSYDETQAHTRNAAPGAEAEEVVDDLLGAGYANWHVTSLDEVLQLRVTKKGRLLLHVSTRPETEHATPDLRHDRAKRRHLDASDPLFTLLGVTTSDGIVKPTRTAKFRQVQDLLAAIDPLVDDAVSLGPGAGLDPGATLEPGRPLRLVDLGCGNAYLTFAAFRYLSDVRELPVSVVGIDVKAQALAHNNSIAEALGVSDRVSFVQGSIEEARLAEAPDLVLALHACDTATDAALARAVAWRAPVVVAAPCCHHDIARQLSVGSTPAPYRLVTRHGILRERLADVLTDALRAALLRLAGYRVEVIEFVDSQHTPRNALIRAVRTDSPADDAAWEAYRDLTSQWGVTPALEPMLRESVPEIGARLG